MSVVDTIDQISSWCQQSICSKIKFKKPDNDEMGGQYEYELIHPVAFPMYVPAMDKLPPNVVSNMPSICVQLMEGQDDLSDNTREMKINLGFSVWNPGIHSKDVYYPTGTRPEETPDFRKGVDGWMDVWNFVDVALRELRNIESINAIKILHRDNIRFGPYKIKEDVADNYPLWLAYIQLTVEKPLIKIGKNYEEYL
ncbi:MAG: hypothetical protein Q4G60_10715 [bacterium]|nr:hypothetical protein [bacterium]